MFLTKSPVQSSLDPVLIRDPVALRMARLNDFSAWCSIREDSRAHLVAWEDNWTQQDITVAAFKRRLRHTEREIRLGVSLPLFVFRREDEALLGGATLSSIRYGASRSAHLGYWIGGAYIRQGYGLAAVMALLDHAFYALQLNRVEAACQPANLASQRLLQRAGFLQEGLARSYLKINGDWRDHLIFALTADDWRAQNAE